MRTFKFLAPGAIGPISGFHWPKPAATGPGDWVEAGGALEPCLRGAHVCRLEDLAYWIADELWETEVDGDSIAGIDCLVVERARLVRRYAAWHAGESARFVEACRDHAAAQLGSALEHAAVSGYLADALECARGGYAACGAFSAALAVAKSAGVGSEALAAYRRERSWQAAWIAHEVIGA